MAYRQRRLRVYIAGPISSGDVWENVTNGVRWGRKMLSDGLAPYVPHLDAYLTLRPAAAPTPQSNWNGYLEWDLEWVSVSDAVFRLDGASFGADKEVEIAEELGIPVFSEHEYDDLLAYAEGEGLIGSREVVL